jgi:ABC-2 type transport system permease protein
LKNLIYIELYKLFGSGRTYVTFGIAIALMLIINLGMYMEGQKIFDFLLESVSEYFYVEGKVMNGYLITYLALNTLWVHIPVLIVIIAASIFAGEFELGTIRLLLTQPIGRGQLLTAKFVAMVVYNLVFMVLTVIAAILPACLLFGTGDLVVFLDGIQFIQEATFLKRLGLALLFSTLSMIAFSCLGMTFSLVFKNTLTSVLFSMGILILSTLLQKFVFGVFSSWQPFLFSYHFSKWQMFFIDKIPVSSILESVGFMMAMILALSLFSYLKFQKMNITE